MSDQSIRLSRHRIGGTIDLAMRMLQEAPVAGGVIAVQRGRERIAVPFGTRGPFGTAVQIEDRFEIGSISKTVTALTAARLAHEGAWDLDMPARRMLPWLELPAGAGEPSLRHLLAHTAGWIAGNSASPGEIAQALAMPSSRSVTAPGEYFHYSNIGYVVLGLAMARVSGAPLGQAVHEAVLAPLGLPGAFASITGSQRAELCPGTVPLRDDTHWFPGDPLSEQNWVEPAGADGNIGASAGELLAFARALTAPDEPAEPWLSAAVASISTPAAPGGEDVLDAGRHLAVNEARYGLGVNVERTELGTLLTHGGGMIGYGAFFVAHPQHDLSVAVTLSAPGEWPYAELLARQAHAEMLGEHSAVRSGVADPISELRPIRPGLAPGDDGQTRFSGHYRSYTPWCPHYQVGADAGGRLVLRAYSGVEAPTEDTLLVPLPGTGALHFRVGEDPRLPERARFGNIIDGAAQTLDIDGCVYARVAAR